MSKLLLRKLDQMFRESLCGPRGPRTGIHVSDLLGCTRAAYYNKTGHGVPPTIQSLLRMRVGTEMHRVRSFPKALYNPKDVFHEKKMEWEGITGTMDEYFRGVILDKKTCRVVPNAPKPGVMNQVQYYRVLAEEGAGLPVTNGAVCYIDVNNCFFRNMLIRIPPHSEETQAEMLARKDAILTAVENGVPPPREPHWCDTCALGKICHEDKVNW